MSAKVRDLHLKRKKMWDASIANHSRYVDEATGLFAEQYVEDRPCPVCETNQELVLFLKEGGQYVKCRGCDMVYLNPVFQDEWLEDYYRTNHSVQSEVVEGDSDFYIGLYRKGLEMIERQAGKPGRILDVGCSSGVFLDVARKSDWETYGVELNEKELKVARDKGHIVDDRLVADLDFDAPFDAVTLWDVFEHMKDGFTYLNELRARLAPGGMIFMQIPSADSLAAKILREECNMFDGLEHVNLYSLKAMEKLAGRCGLEILVAETVISEIGVMNNYLSYESPYFGTADNTVSLLSLLDEKDIHDKKLGYKLQLLLRPSA